MGFFQDLAQRHQALKERIHSTRIPLSPRGVAVMKVVYVMTPVVAGMLFMEGIKRRCVGHVVHASHVVPPPPWRHSPSVASHSCAR